MYAAPGTNSGSHTLSPLTIPLTDKSGNYDQLHRQPVSEEMVGEDMENVDEDHPYEQLGPPLFSAVASEYQKLSDTSLEGKEASKGGYASLYKVPKSSQSLSNGKPPTPPHPPQFMPPTVGGARPENPYIISLVSSTNSIAMTTTPPTTPKKNDLTKGYAKLDEMEVSEQ